MTSSDKKRSLDFLSTSWTVLWFALLTLPAAILAYYRIFTGFAEWDDEGTLMMMVRQYLTGYKPYQEIFSGYGPVYFYYSWLVRASTGMVVDHNTVRITSAVVSLLCTLICAWMVLRLTKSIAAATVAHLLIFRGLLFLTSEPGHPQELCLILVTCLVASGMLATSSRVRWFAMAAAGAMAADLTLVKVNVGIFAVLAIALTLVFQMPEGGFWRLARYATSCAALLLPFALMRVHLNDPGGQAYCLVVTASIAGVLAGAASFGRRGKLSVHDCLAAMAGFAVTFALSLLLLAHQGVTMRATFNALIMNQIRMNVSPGFWYQAIELSRAWVGWALAGVAAAIFASRAVWREKDAVYRGLVCFRLLLGVAGLLLAGVMPSYLLGFVTPFCWLLLFHPADDMPSWQVHGRLLLCTSAVLHTLIAFPMAGSQAFFLRILLMVVVSVVLMDGLHSVRQWTGFAPVIQRIARPGGAVVMAAVALAYPVLAFKAKRTYEASYPLNLPGAERIHLDQDVAEDLQWVVANLRQNCDTFIGLPGLPSLYFWTGKPLVGRVDQLPGQLNFDQWMDLFTPAQQEAIAADFSRHPNACAIYHPSGVDFWNTGNRDVRSWPLANYILTNFKTIGQSGDYQFMIRNERQLEIPKGTSRPPVKPRRR